MSTPRLDDAALPLLFQISDKTSIQAQSSYYNLLVAYLLLLILAAAASTVSDENSRIGAIVSLLSFAASLAVLIWRNDSKLETWYSNRAVAESTKTRAWRWAMRANPYDKGDLSDQSKQHLVTDLQDIVVQNEAFSGFDKEDITVQNSISEVMTSLRALPLEERLAAYKEQRVDEQAAWYERKASYNKTRSKRWRMIAFAFHAIAMILLVMRIINPSDRLPIEVISTLASAVLSWMEAKRYSELKSSYRLAADEISRIQDDSRHVHSDQALSAFVLNSESAFSREHTQWIARSSA